MRHVTDFAVVHAPTPNAPAAWMRLTAVVLLGLPSLAVATDAPEAQTLIRPHTLTVAGVAGDSTVFQRDGFMHGFGYDLTRAYADREQLKLQFKTYRSNQAALAALKAGKVDLALTTASVAQTHAQDLVRLDLSCGHNAELASYGLNPEVNWSFAPQDGNVNHALVSAANALTCQAYSSGISRRLAAFYDQNMMRNSIEKASLRQAWQQRLPEYLPHFQANAKQNKLDWHLLAAIGYQESHLKPDAVSPTGVSGLMMLTQATASDMGVLDRNDPLQSIEGGAKYFGHLLKQYPHSSSSDRVWFALVAYNMGPNALEQVRAKVKKAGNNPHAWSDVFELMATQSSKNASYRQAVQYVTRIRAYLETIKLDRKLARL